MTLWELFVQIKGDNSGFKKSVQESGSELTKFGKVADGVGAKLATALGFAGIGTAAFAAAGKFEEASVKIQRATGATGAKLESLEASFTNVYKATAASSEQVSQALALMSTRTGATGKSLEDLTLKVMKLAKTQNEDVATITPLVTRAFGDWSIATNRQGDAMDYLRAVSQQTGTSVARLSEQVVYAGAPLRQLGYNFEQSAALIGKFEKEGVNTELVLGGMKAALQKFAHDGVTDTAKAWKEFVAGVKSGSVTLQDVMKEVGAKRGVDLYKAITEGRFEIDKMVDSLKTLAVQGGTNIETLQSKITKWRHGLEALVVSHKDLLMAVGFLTPAVIALKDAVKFAITKIGTIVAGATALLSNPVVLALLAGGAAIGIGYSQLQGATAAFHSLDAAFDKWITDQTTGAKTADDLAKAEQRVNDAFEKGLLSKEQTGKLLAIIHENQNKIVGQDWNDYAKSMGISITVIKKPVVDLAKAQEEARKAAEAHARAVSGALATLGIESKRYQELGSALRIVYGEYKAGKLSVDQWVEALQNAGREIEKHKKQEVQPIFSSEMAAERDKEIAQLWQLPKVYDAVGESIRMTMEPFWEFINAQDLAARNSAIMEEAFKRLGVTSAAELQKQADAAQEAYELIRDDAESTTNDITRAWLAAERKQIAATQAKGEAVSEEYKRVLDEIEADLDTATNVHARKAEQKVSAFGRQVSTILTDLGRELSEVVLSEKKIGDAFEAVGKAIVRTITEQIIANGIKKLMSALSGVLNHLGSIGKAIGGILGSGASGAASGAASAAGSVASGAAGAGSAAASATKAVSSGVMGTIGAIASVGTLVSSVIGNFQQAKMETTMNAVEHNTRYAALYLGDRADGGILGQLFKIGDYLQFGTLVHAVEDFRNKFWDWSGKMLNANGGSGGVSLSFSNCTFGGGITQSDVNTMFNSAVRQARLAGARI